MIPKLRECDRNRMREVSEMLMLKFYSGCLVYQTVQKNKSNHLREPQLALLCAQALISLGRMRQQKPVERSSAARVERTRSTTKQQLCAQQQRFQQRAERLIISSLVRPQGELLTPVCSRARVSGRSFGQ